MNFKVSSKKTSEDEGIVYILLVKLEDRELVKIGVTSRLKIQERVCEILTSIWIKYRVFPECYPKRFKTTTNIYEKETKLHQYFANYKYKTEHQFSGSTELFDIPLDIVVDAYEKLLKNEDIGDIYGGE